MKLKKCLICKKKKRRTSFSTIKRRYKTKIYMYPNSYCKKCDLEDWQERRNKNLEKYKNAVENWRKRNPKREKYHQYKRGAKQRGISFTLVFDQFTIFWQKRCAYCGNKIKTIGLDRVNNNKGYMISNIAPCCKTCNIMKQSLSRTKFINHCRKIVVN